MLEALRDYDRFTAAVEKGEEELVPHEIVARLAAGESPIKVWREYRNFTNKYRYLILYVIEVRIIKLVDISGILAGT